MLVFSLLNGLLVLFLPSEALGHAYSNIARTENFRVHNLNTAIDYLTIHEAINAPETLDGHKISIAPGTYYEHVTVTKSLSLVGEERSSTIVDGNGAGTIVYVTASNVEIKNLTIRNGTFGLWFYNSQNSKIVGNTLQNVAYGIRLLHSGNAEVSANKVHNSSWFGVQIDSSGHTKLRDNTLDENKYNFGVDGTSLSDFVNDIDSSNTVNGKPIRYLINQHSITIDSSFPEFGYLALVNSTDARVQNLNVQDNIQGVLLAFTTNSVVNNINARENWNGIYIAYSRNVSVTENNSNNNFDYGIKFFNSSNSLARGNNLDNNGWSGIGLFRSPNSIVDHNEANFNTYNLHLVFTNNSVITGNNAQGKSGGYSIAIYYSHNNEIYHNSFSNSLLFVETRNYTRFTPRNSWDNGLEGNYWNSYKGVDLDQDGTGDTLYTIGENNVDNHPLMGKLSDFAISLDGTTYNITVISNSTISEFQFTSQVSRTSFTAAGFNGTVGFSRIAVPNTLLQRLNSGNITVLINGEQPPLKRKWTDEARTYWYFSYVNSAYQSIPSNPWFIVASASTLLIVAALAVAIHRKKHRLEFSHLSKKRYDS